MIALPAHSPFQSAVRALSDGSETGTGVGESARVKLLCRNCGKSVIGFAFAEPASD